MLTITLHQDVEPGSPLLEDVVAQVQLGGAGKRQGHYSGTRPEGLKNKAVVAQLRAVHAADKGPCHGVFLNDDAVVCHRADIVPLLLPGFGQIVIHGLVGGLEAFGLDGVGFARAVFFKSDDIVRSMLVAVGQRNGAHQRIAGQFDQRDRDLLLVGKNAKARLHVVDKPAVLPLPPGPARRRE